MQGLRNVWLSFFEDRGFSDRNLWFKRMLYIFFIYKGITWSINFDVLFAENSVLFPEYHSIGPFRDLAFVLLSHSADNWSWWFILISSLISFYRLFFNPSNWLISFGLDLMLWFLILNLHNKMYFGLSGGNILLNQFLLFNCFINKKPPEGKSREILYFFENFSILALRVQVMILYLVSALFKLQHEEWLNGKALIQVMQTAHFSAFEINTSNFLVEGLLFFLNYVVLAFQLFFPLAVWWKRINRSFLWLGIFMHLFIGWFMGLPEFAFIMLLGYFYFWPHQFQVSGSRLPDRT